MSMQRIAQLAAFALDVTKEELAANGEAMLARANSLVLKKINGTMVIIR